MKLKSRIEFLNESLNTLFGVDEKKEALKEILIRFGTDEKFYDNYHYQNEITLTDDEHEIFNNISHNVIDVISLLNDNLDTHIYVISGIGDNRDELEVYLDNKGAPANKRYVNLIKKNQHEITKKDVADALLKYLKDKKIL